MIRHLALFKLNEGVQRDEPRVAAGGQAFADLGALIPEVRSWECGWNISDRPIAYDFAVSSAHTDREALQRFLQHPAHQAVVKPWSEFATWVIADYEI